MPPNMENYLQFTPLQHDLITSVLTVGVAALLVLLHFGEGDGLPALREKGVCTSLGAVGAGRVVDLTEDESQQLSFDSVLTVQPNAELLERLVTAALA